jgi:cation-transporting P-type ATPase E
VAGVGRARGLTADEAARRLAQRGPSDKPASSRSYASIVRANVFTVFNLILLFFGVLTLAFGASRDALFLVVLVANAGIGIAQEIRAKHALDRLAALVTPTARVVRDGRPLTIGVDDVVVDDLVRLEAGDQVVADGRVETANALTLDESVLTGESRAVTRAPGEDVRSGSFVVEGAGEYVVTAVGNDSYAQRITGEARTFRKERSPLERALNRLLLILVAVLVPLSALLGYALWERKTPIRDAVSTAVAAGVTLVPEGLILLTSVTFAVAALGIARRGALAQRLNAVEALAGVDVLCVDKTGTLTEPELRVTDVVAADGDREALTRELGRFAASSPTANETLEAIRAEFPAPAEPARSHVPFSSRWRWSAVQLDGAAYVLGAPERVGAGELAGRAEEEAARGRRVLAFGRARAADLSALDPRGQTPDSVPLGLVVLAERLRPNVRETVSFFLDQGVALKVLSGDRPETVAAIARDVGIPAGGKPVDGSALPEDPFELRRLVLAASVVGRIPPDGKRRVVEALAGAGRFVAMLGDGVNDVPALKAARLSIAQGTGTQMARSVSDLVLVRGDFGAVPVMVAEGRKVFRNLRRVAKLFVTKSMFAVFLILSVGLTPIAYPLLPRHLTLAGALTIGIPSFFLALAPSSGTFGSQGFLRDVARFAVPAGASAGLGVLASYFFALNVANLPLRDARTVATSVLVLVGLYLILALEAEGRKRGAAVSALCAALAALYVLVLLFHPARSFFGLSGLGFAIAAISLVGAALAMAGLWLSDDQFVPGRRAPS